MKNVFDIKNSILYILFSTILLSGCALPYLKPVKQLNNIISRPYENHREPKLGLKWLAVLTKSNEREQIELIDLRLRRKVNLPGLNRSDALPISLAVNSNGNRVVFVRQRGDLTELYMYRRGIGTLQKLDLSPKGVPRRVSIDGSGRILAVEVSREGRWDIDIIRIPN